MGFSQPAINPKPCLQTVKGWVNICISSRNRGKTHRCVVYIPDAAFRFFRSHKSAELENSSRLSILVSVLGIVVFC